MPILNIHMISDLQDPRALLSLSQEQVIGGRPICGPQSARSRSIMGQYCSPLEVLPFASPSAVLYA